MVRQVLSITMIAAGLVACGPKNGGPDILQDNKVTTIARETKCTVGNADGVRCDRKTCKKDQRSDCTDFADRCQKYGHTYEGDNDSGECIRDTNENVG